MLRFARACLVLVLSSLPLWSVDADKDGIDDAIETALGLSPTVPDDFVLVIQDGVEGEAQRAKPAYKPERDVVALYALHAGGDRNVWRVDFAAPPKPESGVLHLYVDADGDETTGRRAGKPIGGTDYMVSAVAGGTRCQHYLPDGSSENGPRIATAVQGNSLYLVCDFPVRQVDGKMGYSVHVLSHDAGQDLTPEQRMSDNTIRATADMVPVRPGDKIRRLADYEKTEGFVGTFDLALIRPALFAAGNIWVGHDALELDGYGIEPETSRRFPCVSRTRMEGSVSTKAPKGTYHVAVLSYDSTSYREGMVLRVDGVSQGAIIGADDNNRFWLRWTEKPIAFQGGETVELVAIGASGSDQLSGILFTAQPPPARGFDCRIENFASQSPVGQAGTVRLSWMATEPTTTVLMYGTTPACADGTVETPKGRVHRAVLTGLDPEQAYHGRIVGIKHDGTPCVLDDLTFSARPPTPKPTASDTKEIPLRVRNPHPVAAANWPVTSGIPFPQGALGRDRDLRLVQDGQRIASQVRTTARWPDGSVKWVLLSFVANVGAESEAAYTLQYGRSIGMEIHGAVVPGVASDVGMSTSAGEYRLTDRGVLVLPDGRECVTHARLADGTELAAAPGGEVRIEEQGEVRTVACATVDLVAPDGRTLGLEIRIEGCSQIPFVRVQHTFTVKGKDAFLELDELTFSVPGMGDRLSVAALAGDPLVVGSGQSLVQRFDDEVLVGTAPRKARLTGTVSGTGGTVAVREFWQNYPKSVELSDGTLRIGLCPDFEKGLYDAFPFEKEGHHLYFYLLNGVYKFRRGMAKTHEILLAPAGHEADAMVFQRPLLATAPPEWYCASRAFYDVAPRDTKRFKAYEEAIDANVVAYAKQREKQRDYGLMNFGDWYGERGANWGNIEYDTQHAFFTEYIRSGNEDAFFLGDQAERHNRDIDTVQWSPSPDQLGFVYIHQMGHVGGYYTESVPGTLGIPQAGSTVSHAWAEGHFDHYFLTGDPRSLATGRAVADYFNHKTLAGWYDFTSCRVPGWHLKINAAAYAATGDPYYLNASRIVVDRVLETQNHEPYPLPEYQCEPGRTYQIGGWSRMMVPGHCLCTPRHRGNAGFMVAVLLSGLKYHHDVTDDPRVKQAIIDGARYLVTECYSDEVHGFRYTSCPKMGYRPGATPLMVEGIARAYRWTRDPKLLDPITNGLSYGARGSYYGKGFSMYYRMAPRLLADLAACDLGLEERMVKTYAPYKKPDWIVPGSVVVQGEDFSGQGGGEVQIKDDRPAWGKVLTYWHQDKGHWLAWTFDVPQDGDYHLRLRYASGSPAPVRDLKVDGEYPFPEAKRLTFEGTGGFGTTPSQWQIRYFETGGKEAVLPLKSGRHTVRMANLGDGMAVDFLVLVPAVQ